MDRPRSMIVALPGSLCYLSFQLVWWIWYDLCLWPFLNHYDTFPSSWCEGQAMINDCGSSWIIIHSIPAGVMDRPWYLPFQLTWWTGHYDTFPSSRCDGHATIHSIPASVMDSPWSMIVALPGLLWYLPLQLVWWTDHDLWLWLFLDYYGTFPSSWCDGQTMIYDCGTSWIIMIVSLPAGLIDRPWSIIVTLPGSLWYIPLQLLWMTDHDVWLWLFLGQYDSFPSSWSDGQTIIYNCDSSWIIMIPSLPAGMMDRQLSIIVYDCGSSWIIMIPSLPAGVMDRP